MTEAASPLNSPEVIEVAEDKHITIDDFMAVELRVGQILTCEPVPKSKKLLKMQVDLGTDKRQILAGMSPYYEPETLINRKVVVVANLKPVKMMGLESQGMLLAAAPEDGSRNPAFVEVEEDMPLGARVR